MGNLILNFLQEQGILIMMGLMVLEGIVHQWAASRRYRRLRSGIQALAAVHGHSEERGQTERGAAGKTVELTPDPMMELQAVPRKRGRRTSRRQEVGRSAPEIASGLDQRAVRRQSYEVESMGQSGVHSPSQETMSRGQNQESQQDLDAQLLYLKQSLDRIAAGRDQKLEEEPREHRKLTPEQEAVIADILREYLS